MIKKKSVYKARKKYENKKVYLNWPSLNSDNKAIRYSIQDWNKLPSSITGMQDIEAFKTALHARIAVQPPSTA